MDLSKDISKKTGLPKTAIFRLDGKATVKTYALNIAENLMHSKLRETVPIAQNEIKTDPTEGFSPLANAAAPVDFGVQLFENQNLVKRFLDKLRVENPDYAKLIELRFGLAKEVAYKEMSHQEIADSKKTVYRTEGSSKRYTSVALKRLQEIARSEGFFSK